jgi:hypothetical protein
MDDVAAGVGFAGWDFTAMFGTALFFTLIFVASG